MSSPKSRRHSPPTPEEELLVLRSQLEADQIVMTRELMVRVLDCLQPYWFGSGIDLFAYYDRPVDEKTRSKDIANEVSGHMQMVDDWCEAWYRCARPDWLDVLADILIDPPLGWMLDEELDDLFLNVAGQYPDKAVKVLAVLFSDEKVHPRLATLLKTIYSKCFD